MTREIEFQNTSCHISAEMQRIGWTTQQGREHLIKTYGKRSRSQLNDDQLLEFLNYLKSIGEAMQETNIKSEGNFEGYVILEIMGHRKLGGYIKEQTIASTNFIRLDTFNEEGEVAATQFYNPSSIYCITPTTKEIAIAYGLRNQPAPVQNWELPKPQLTVIAGAADDSFPDVNCNNENCSNDYTDDDYTDDDSEDFE